MTLDLRLQALMRRRGIKSQSQLARLAGVSQSSIHRILLASPGYTPTRGTLVRLAHALDSSASWLSEGAAVLHWPNHGPAHEHAGAGAGSGDGDVGDIELPGDTACAARFDSQHEWRGLFAQLSRAEREALLELARLMLQRRPVIGSKTPPSRSATAPSLAPSDPAEYPLEPARYEICPIE